MLTRGLDHVATITNDGDRLKEFYVEVFGWRVWYDNELVADRRFPPTPSGRDERVHLVILETTDPVIGKLGLLQYLDSPFENDAPTGRSTVRLGEPVLVVATKDVDGVHERALARGASVVTAPVDWTVPTPDGAGEIHLRTVSLFDPNGIYLEVSAHPGQD